MSTNWYRPCTGAGVHRRLVQTLLGILRWRKRDHHRKRIHYSRRPTNCPRWRRSKAAEAEAPVVEDEEAPSGKKKKTEKFQSKQKKKKEEDSIKRVLGAWISEFSPALIEHSFRVIGVDLNSTKTLLPLTFKKTPTKDTRGVRRIMMKAPWKKVSLMKAIMRTRKPKKHSLSTSTSVSLAGQMPVARAVNLDRLFHTAFVGDKILEAFTVCAPWMALGKSGNKQEGEGCQGHSGELGCGGREELMDAKSVDVEKAWPREVELVKGWRGGGRRKLLINCAPVSKLTIMGGAVTGVASNKQKGRV
ncbi:hypothetical protein RUND412_007845 [Rhizina undulata]